MGPSDPLPYGGPGVHSNDDNNNITAVAIAVVNNEMLIILRNACLCCSAVVYGCMLIFRIVLIPAVTTGYAAPPTASTRAQGRSL
jgi:hypothetical protein